MDFESYLRSCPDSSLRNQFSWRRDFLENPDDFQPDPRTCNPEKTRALWRQQLDLIREELRRRGLDPRRIRERRALSRLAAQTRHQTRHLIG